jgi:hypothetical protein
VSIEARAPEEDVHTQPLPTLTTELFVGAGALVAERLTHERAGPAQVEEVLRRVVDQCLALAR